MCVFTILLIIIWILLIVTSNINMSSHCHIVWFPNIQVHVCWGTKLLSCCVPLSLTLLLGADEDECWWIWQMSNLQASLWLSHKYFVFNYHGSTTVKATDLPQCTLLTFWDLFNLLRLCLTLASSREPPLTTTAIDPDRTCREYNSDRTAKYKRVHQDSWWPRQHYSTGWHSGVATRLTRYF